MTEKFTVSGSIWIIGCGNMAGAMLRRWLDAGLDRESVMVVRPSGVAPAPGVRTLSAIPMDEASPRILVLGVKPQKLAEVADAVAAAVGPGTLIISILAGTELETLRTRFPEAGAVIRAMPNTPVAIGRGVVGLGGDAGDRRGEVDALMAPLGTCLWIADEDQLHVVGALGGSGPAFVFRFIAALAAGAEALDMPAAQAMTLAVAMVDGAAGLAAASDESADRLAERVTSPGGMTRKGLDILDGDPGLRELVTHALAASVARSREMAAETR